MQNVTSWASHFPAHGRSGASSKHPVVTLLQHPKDPTRYLLKTNWVFDRGTSTNCVAVMIVINVAMFISITTSLNITAVFHYKRHHRITMSGASIRHRWGPTTSLKITGVFIVTVIIIIMIGRSCLPPVGM